MLRLAAQSRKPGASGARATASGGSRRSPPRQPRCNATAGIAGEERRDGRDRDRAADARVTSAASAGPDRAANGVIEPRRASRDNVTRSVDAGGGADAHAGASRRRHRRRGATPRWPRAASERTARADRANGKRQRNVATAEHRARPSSASARSNSSASLASRGDSGEGSASSAAPRERREPRPAERQRCRRRRCRCSRARSTRQAATERSSRRQPQAARSAAPRRSCRASRRCTDHTDASSAPRAGAGDLASGERTFSRAGR